MNSDLLPMPFTSDHPRRRLWPRLLMSAMLGLAAGLSLTHATIAFEAGEVLFSLVTLLMGLLLSVVAVIEAWRGGRLGVEIQGDDLVVEDHFSERRIPLGSIKRVSRGLDCTIVETTEGYPTIDDFYFSSALTRNAFLSEVAGRIGSRS